MKILIYYPESLFPVNSGGRNRIYNLANNLSKWHNILFIGLNYSLKNKIISKRINNNFKYLEIGKQSIYDKATFRFKKIFSEKFILVPSHWKYFKNFNPDLVISEHCFCFFQCYLYATRNKIPVLLDQQNFESEINTQYPYLKFEFWEKLALKHASLITCCSESDKRKFIKFAPSVENRIHIIENGVDPEKIKPNLITRDKIREKLGFKKNDFIFAFHGSANYRPNKEALEFIYKNLNNFKIIIFGRDVPRKITKNIRSLGCVSNLNDYLSACDAGIVPLSSGSGTRLKILEYFSCEKPVISTKKGAEGLCGLKNKNNIIFSDLKYFNKSMNSLQSTDGKDLQLSIGKNARNLIVQKYDWNSIVKKLNKIILNFYS